MSYPGSFFQEEAEETQAVPKARPNRRTSRMVPATNPGVTPQQQLENAQALAAAQLMQQQQQRLPGQWAPHINFSAIPGQPNVNVATQDEQDSEEAPPLPRGSRLEAKRVDEVFDPLTSTYKMQDGFVDSTKKKKAGLFEEFVLVLWRKITPSPMPGAAPIILTTIEIKSTPLKQLCEEIIGNFMGTVWNNPQMRVSLRPKFSEHGLLANFP